MMTVDRLLEYTEMDGLKIEYLDGELALVGEQDCINFWKVFISDYKEQVINRLEGKGNQQNG